MNPHARPVKPKTPNLDHWNAFKESQKYDDLWDLLNAIDQRKVRLDDQCDEAPKNNLDEIIKLGTTLALPSWGPGEIMVNKHPIDDILKAYIGINIHDIRAEEELMRLYHEEVRTQNQKIEVLAGVNIGSTTVNKTGDQGAP